MCGFVGTLSPLKGAATSEATLRLMTEQLRHRGPDREAVWSDPEAGIAFGHTRLAIVDLSPCGDQPMASETGRYVTVFNGEIYNFIEIRRTLERIGKRFVGHSDTEVMLGAFEQWGVVGGVKKFVGMFALALWDRRDRELHLIRDRFGEKPLYYGAIDGTLIFASELKALRRHPGWSPEIDRNALALYLRHNYVPAPYTIYKGIKKAPPGRVLTFRAHERDRTPLVDQYWSARAVAEEGIAHPFTGNEAEIVDRCDELLRHTVAQEMIADVPLGAFLSGGIDSSLIVALMQTQSAAKVRTFTIGFREPEYNEAPHAARVAAHLGTDHTELYVSPKETLSVIPQIPTIYDEPFADSSQIPTFLVSQLARRQVTVSLSGDGGDELFGGYPRYHLEQAMWTRTGAMPPFIRTALADFALRLKSSHWDSALRAVSWSLPERYKRKASGKRVHSAARMMKFETVEGLYHELVSIWPSPLDVVTHAEEPLTALTDIIGWLASPSALEKVMYLDSVSYLPDDILTKVDRASMAVSLESRSPFLDHRVAEFAWRLPLEMKIRGAEGKWILRRVLERYVPAALTDRPKMGFGVPIDQWLRGPLRDWGEALIEPQRLLREGYFNPKPIQEKWTEHQSGKQNWQYPLWGVLMFQSWLETQSGS